MNSNIIEVIDEIGEIAKGTAETLTLSLGAGSYQLVCNLPDHSHRVTLTMLRRRRMITVKS